MANQQRASVAAPKATADPTVAANKKNAAAAKREKERAAHQAAVQKAAADRASRQAEQDRLLADRNATCVATGDMGSGRPCELKDPSTLEDCVQECGEPVANITSAISDCEFARTEMPSIV